MARRHLTRRLGRPEVIVAAILLAACSETDKVPPLEPTLDLAPPGVTAGQYWVCKYGNFASFDVTIRSELVGSFDLAPDDCWLAYENNTSVEASVMVTEVADANLYQLMVTTLRNGQSTSRTIIGQSAFNSLVGPETGAVVTFFNYGGCAGYWRNHLDEWTAPGYGPSDDFDTTFGVDLYDPDITLGQATNAEGGKNAKLARHATYALLNAGHPGVNYPFTTAEVIAGVQGGDKHAINQLAEANEAGCVLD